MKTTQTINFHINSDCNADCVYCYRSHGTTLPTEDRCEIIRQIAELPGKKRRINFAGGEPTLIKTLADELSFSKALGLETSIITNGSVMVKCGAQKYIENLDMIGLSVDSNDTQTNNMIERPDISESEWIELCSSIHENNVVLKINTVVTSINASENLANFISTLKPQRWKILRAIPVEGVNDKRPDNWLPSDEEFSSFVDRHNHLTKSGVDVVVENDDDLRGSYVMINPEGRFYDSTNGGYHYSDRILDVGLEEAFSQISYSKEKYIRRLGEYEIKFYLNPA